MAVLDDLSGTSCVGVTCATSRCTNTTVAASRRFRSSELEEGEMDGVGQGTEERKRNEKDREKSLLISIRSIYFIFNNW